MERDRGRNNVILVEDRSRIKALRERLEQYNHYDNSRCIQWVKFSIPGNPETIKEYCAMPITLSCEITLKNMSPLPHPYTDCTLAYAELPLSKRARAKSQTPHQVLREAVRSYLTETGWYTTDNVETLLLDVPRSWERHGDLIVLPEYSFQNVRWQPHIECALKGTGEHKPEHYNQSTDDGSVVVSESKPSLLDVIATALDCKRLAIDGKVTCDSYRSSGAKLLLGDSGWVKHTDNGVCYVFDVTRCMFSSGNISEKIRVANLNCIGETVVDLYAGIGYFTLPYLVHTGAAVVHACEWNSRAVEALEKGLVVNGVRDRCIIHQGDNRKFSPVGVADRVNLGLVPSSEGGWSVACRALKSDTGGWLHIHGNVSSKQVPRENSSPSNKQLERTSRECNPWEEGATANETDSSQNFNLSIQCQASKHQIDKQLSLLNISIKSKTTAANYNNGQKDELCLGQELSPVESWSLETKVTTDASEQELSPSPLSLSTKAPVCASKQEVWEEWAQGVACEIGRRLRRENPLESGRDWQVTVGHIEHVKSYAPHVDHLVVDLECRPTVQHY